VPLTEREYWRERRKWALAHTELWTRGKFISGPLVGILAFILQLEWGLRLVIPTVQFVVTLVAAYFIVALAQVIINWVYYAPVALERIRLREIEELTNENKNLNKKEEKPVTFQFTKVSFEQKPNATVIIVWAKVSNRLNFGHTIHNIRLTTHSDKTISLCPTLNAFPKHNVDDIRFSSGMVEGGYLQFEWDGIDHDWILEYSDNRGNPHREPIPKELYRLD
jgi:hypothetical protein